MKTHILTSDEISALFPPRSPDANKGSVGRGLLAAGSYSMPGAAIIAATGAVNSGIGLLTLAFPDVVYPAVTANLTESVLLPCASANGGFAKEAARVILEKAKTVSAVAVGPGLGQSSGAEYLVRTLLAVYTGRLILDADALNIVAREPELLKDSPADIGLTPHPGEMSRLTGLSIEEIQSRREETAAEFAREYGAATLLKGRNTVIAAPDGRVSVNPTGCPAMARGGCGDLLTGMTLAFAAKGLTVFDALCAGAYLHGAAGERAAARYGEECATVGRIAEEIRVR